MPMGLYKHISGVWKQPKEGMPSRYRIDRMAGWRRDPVFSRIDKPTRIDAELSDQRSKTLPNASQPN